MEYKAGSHLTMFNLFVGAWLAAFHKVLFAVDEYDAR